MHVTGPVILLHHNGGDEKTAEDEEHVHPLVTMPDPVQPAGQAFDKAIKVFDGDKGGLGQVKGVKDDHKDDRQRPQPIQGIELSRGGDKKSAEVLFKGEQTFFKVTHCSLDDLLTSPPPRPRLHRAGRWPPANGLPRSPTIWPAYCHSDIPPGPGYGPYPPAAAIRSH